MKLFLKRSLALFVSIVLLFGVLPEMGVTKPIVGEAQAAGSTFEEEDFRLAYAKTLLSQVGKRYGAGGAASGYTVNGTFLWQPSDRVTTGTPLSPASLDGNTSYDCFGLVVTTLMAMGYDYFEDTNGVRYPLNGHYGGGIFNQQSCSGDMRSILYDHGTGDRILLHHSNDSKYNIWFLIGEIVDKGTNDNSVKAGDLLFTLTEEDPLNTNKAPGPFSAGQIYNVNHGAVALFTLKRAVNDTMPQNGSYAQGNISAAAIGYSSSYPSGWEEACAVLENSWTRANNQVKSLFGVDLSGGKPRGDSSYYIPYIWDARGRGFKAANSSDYKRGFLDTHSYWHFETPYSSVWQIESLGDPGVSVNNNPFGKTSFRMTVKMEPIDSAFAVTINKTDKDTAEKLSGATFALQLWSEAAGMYVTSTEYEIKEHTTGVYRTYNKSTNALDYIPWTDDNLGKVKVVETGAPPGHSNLDSSNQPLQWTHEFPNNGINTQGWTIDAENPVLKGNLTIVKQDSDYPKAGTYWFRITGPDPSCPRWASISLTAAQSQNSVTINNLAAGAYNVTEVTGNGSNTAVSPSAAFPFDVSGGGAVTVPGGGTGTTTVVNTPIKGRLQITKSVPNNKWNSTFWFMVTGPDSTCPRWISISLAPGVNSKSELIENLIIGNYTITEVTGNGSTTPPASGVSFPYDIAPATTVSVTKNATSTATMTNTPQFGKLQITKSIPNNNRTGTYWFMVTGPDPTCPRWISITLTSGTNNKSELIENLVIGDYTVTEVTGDGSTTAPTSGVSFPYDITPATNVSVTKNATVGVTMTNTPQTGKLQITKNIPGVDQGGTFWFYITGPDATCPRWTSITLEPGTSSKSELIENLIIGDYTVTEVTGDGSTTAPTASASFPYSFTGATTVGVAKGATATVTMTNTPLRGGISIDKTVTGTTKNDGTYWFKVTGPMAGTNAQYAPTDRWYSVNVEAGTDKTASVIANNLPIGTYTVLEVTGNGSNVAVTSSPSFPFGVPAAVNANVVTGVTTNVPIDNAMQYGGIRIRKNLDRPMPDDYTFWFKVSGPSDNARVVETAQWVSITIHAGDTSEQQVLNNLPIGKYSVLEVTGDGSNTAVSTTDAFPFVATGTGSVTVTNGSVVDSDWTNEYRKGNLTLTKIDADGPLGNIEFTIYDEDTCTTELGKLTTAADGTATSDEFLIPLTGRKVYVKETKTDAYHILNTTVFEVELVPNSTVVVSGAPITNEIITGKIGLTKTGETFVGYTETSTEYGPLKTPKYATAGLAGAKFMIFKASDVTVSGTSVTYNPADAVETLTSTGSEVLSGELPLGKYVVVEHEAPIGYVRVPYVGTVELKKKDETTVLVVEHLTHKNQQAETSIGVYKEAEVMVTTTDGERITTTVQLQPGAGFVFGVYAAQDFVGSEATIKEGDLVLVGTTNADGRIDFTTKVPLGKYVIKELKTKDGYEISTDTYPVEIKATTGTETLIKVTALPSDGAIINGLRKKKLTVTKKSLTTDDPLPGTRIQIFDEEGHVIFDQITGEDGTIPAFYALYGRTYYFKEQYAPSGYAILTETFSFSIDAEGNVLGATELKDDVTKIRLLKTTEGGQPLKGVEFTLYDLEELPVQVVTSDENGIVEFKEIAYGDYIIKETRPAEGMQLADFRLDVHIDGTWVNDEPIKVVNLPDEQTGEPINIVFFGFLMAVICACFVIAFCYDQRIKAKAEANFIDSVNNCYARK